MFFVFITATNFGLYVDHFLRRNWYFNFCEIWDQFLFLELQTEVDTCTASH